MLRWGISGGWLAKDSGHRRQLKTPVETGVVVVVTNDYKFILINRQFYLTTVRLKPVFTLTLAPLFVFNVRAKALEETCG